MYKIELLNDNEGFVVTATNVDNGNSVDEREDYNTYEEAVVGFENMVDYFKEEGYEVEEFNEVQKIYNEWRKVLEAMDGDTDCGEPAIRQDFIKWLGNEIEFEDMLSLEKCYE